MRRALVLVGPAPDALETLATINRVMATGGGFDVVGRVGEDDAAGPGHRDPGGDGPAWLGDLDALADLGAELYHAVAFDPARRRADVARLPPGLRAPVLVDPAALVTAHCRLAAGTRVDAFGMISTFAVLGRHVIVASGAGVGHDAVIGDFVTIGPGAVLTGGVIVGAGATIGARASVLEEIRVGAGAVVAPGAVVTRDVPDGAYVAGIPARPVATPGPDDSGPR